MSRSWTLSLFLLLAGCTSGPMLGIVSPDAIGARYLRLRNTSRGYVVFRVTASGAEPLETPLLPPGADAIYEMSANLGTLCPELLHIEMAAYARLHPELSPLEDETVVSQPYASTAVDLLSGTGYGCSADVSWVNLDWTIDCNVREVDEAAGAIGFQAGWLSPQRQVGLQLDQPPLPTPATVFPLNGRIVNLNNEPLAGVEIRLPQLDVSIFTDAAGRFSILRPAGTYLLEPVLPGIEVSPVLRSFTHHSEDEAPIEFIALTEATSVASKEDGRE